MRNPALAADHLRRAQARLRALDVLYDAESWADVVRESQEVVELALKGLLHAVGVDPPRVHDVADVLEAERGRLPPEVANDLEGLTAASRSLRRDRELAFYGAPDIVPSGFYSKADASGAREMARFVVDRAAPSTPGGG
ncbi:MAG: HEPN domain-containing protein [Holophagales bacterium]|nr:HEPN domain-containing protein [Holophagales bacterium]MYF04291.1 HEPN domain-containing protein [Holophagales bacterium]MYJ25103.1 HEPN domain-containing protein [Holophagales bacterium]